MTGQPTVTVIICVKNGASTIRRQLDALDGQVDHPPFEIIVVDNGSTDSTAEVVRAWLDTRNRDDVPAQLVDASNRASIPYARNRGALASTGRIIAYCDADDRVDERWVGAMAGALQSDGIAGGRIEGIGPDGAPRPETFPHGLTSTPYLPHVGNCNMAITRNCFAAIGGYDESLPRYGFEDVDISWRAQEAGYPIHYVPEAIVHFSVSPKVKALKKEFLIAQGRVAISLRHPEAYPGGFTLSGCLANLSRRAVALPWRMIHPGTAPRTRHIRWFVDACGFLAGYFKYARDPRGHEPELLAPDSL